MLFMRRAQREALEDVRQAFAIARDGADLFHANYQCGQTVTHVTNDRGFGVVREHEFIVPENTFNPQRHMYVPYHMAEEAFTYMEDNALGRPQTMKEYLVYLESAAQRLLTEQFDEETQAYDRIPPRYVKVQERFVQPFLQHFVETDTSQQATWGFAHLPSAVLRVWFGTQQVLLPFLAHYVDMFQYDVHTWKKPVLRNCGDRSVLDVAILIAFAESKDIFSDMDGTTPWYWVAPVIAEHMVENLHKSPIIHKFFAALDVLPRVPVKV